MVYLTKLLYARQSLHDPCTTDDTKVQINASDVMKGSADSVINKSCEDCRLCSNALPLKGCTTIFSLLMQKNIPYVIDAPLIVVGR